MRDDLGAIAKSDRNVIDPPLRPAFADSLDLDEALRKASPQENRWDYLLGHEPSASVVALERHPATTRGIRDVIGKREAAMKQLRAHLADGKKVRSWLWVASGRNDFADTDKAVRRLDEHGITFVGPRLLARHLPPPAARSTGRRL